MILSLVVGFAALGLAWMTYKRSFEDIQANVVPLSEHPVFVVKLEPGYAIERRFNLYLANRSSEDGSIVSVFVGDEINPKYIQLAQIMSGEIPEEFSPISLGAGDSRKVTLGYFQLLPKDCVFEELKRAAGTRLARKEIESIFASHGKTFPYCDELGQAQSVIEHNSLVFLIKTNQGTRLARRAGERLKRSEDGTYRAFVDPPEPRGD